MSSSVTRTTTFTVADIRKVVDRFAADFSMKAQATGLRSRESVADTVTDLRVFAEHGYLIDVNLILKDHEGKVLRASEYEVSESAIGWSNDRPGNNMWPRTPDGVLKVVANLNAAWWSKTDAQKAAFIQNWGLHSSWDATSEDLSFNGLSSTPGQRYASNGYGWARTDHQ